MLLSAIAAMGKNRQIGLENKLPWKNPKELEHFKDMTYGDILIMGRKTFESIKKPLFNRKIIVISKTTSNNSNDVFFVKTPLEALELAKFMKPLDIKERVWVCGGESIYKELMPYINRIVLSEVEYDGEADTYFPEFEGDFHCSKMTHNKRDGFKVFYYERFNNQKYN